MADNLQLPILFSQLPNVSKIANADSASPQIRQDMAMPQVAEKLEKEGNKPQEIPKTEETIQVKDQEQRGAQGRHRRDRKKNREKENLDEELATSNASPWTGNIVNKRV